MSASSKKKLRKEQQAAALTEKQLNEQKESKKLRNQTIVFVVVVALVLAIGLASLAVTAYKNSGITERMTTALTIGEHKVTAAELNYFYLDAINSTYQNWYNEYGEYTSTYLSMLYGLDLTKPLNEQVYDKENNKSYADYFVDLAVQDAVSAYALYDQAMAANHTMDEASKASVDDAMKNLEAARVASGHASVADYLKSFYGSGATEKSFRNYLELIGFGRSYEMEKYNSLAYTAEDLAAHNEEHFNDYSSFSYSTFYLKLDDFLMCTAPEGDEDHEHSQEELDATKEAAEKAANAIVAAKPTNEEEFNAAIKKIDKYADSETANCTVNEDLLFTSIPNEQVAAWLADSARKSGDMTIITNATETTDENGNKVSNPYGFTIVLFEGRDDNEMKLVNVRHILNAFTGATTDDKGNTVYPQASIDKSKETIVALEKNWLSGPATEETFAELAKLNTNDGGSMANGGLYENVFPGQMVPAFNDWCFDEARQPGDHEIIETEYGFHLMYFVGHSDITFRDYMIENVLRNEEYNTWYTELVEAAKYTVNNTSTLKLDITLAGN